MEPNDFTPEQIENLKKLYGEMAKARDEDRKLSPPCYPPITVGGSCPRCGYCQHCGRGGPVYSGYLPSYWYWPSAPGMTTGTAYPVSSGGNGWISPTAKAT